MQQAEDAASSQVKYYDLISAVICVTILIRFSITYKKLCFLA